MLIEMLQNTFPVDLTDLSKFSTNNTKKVSNIVVFKYFARIYNQIEDNIYDKDAYVCLNDGSMNDVISRAITYLEKEMYINTYPKKNPSSINRFVTKFSFKVTENILGLLEEFNAEAIRRNIPNTKQCKFYVIAMHAILNQLIQYVTKVDGKYKDHIIYVDMIDSVVNSAYCGFFTTNSRYPILTTNSIVNTSKQKDIQVSFAEKGEGVVSASFNINPFMLNTGKESILYDSIDGNVLKITNDKVVVDYVGSIATPELIYNYKKFRSNLVLKFVPDTTGNKIYSSVNTLTKFNEFIEYIETGVYGSLEKMLMELPLKLSSIELSVNTSLDVDIYAILRSFINSLYIGDFFNNTKFNYIKELLNNEEKFKAKVIKVDDNTISFIDENLPEFKFGALFYK